MQYAKRRPVPDLDMIYFYTVDGRQHLHHGYWTHIPLFWVIVCAGAIATCVAFRLQRFVPIIILATVNILAHCFLDTVVAGILWHKPFSHRYTVFAQVPNVYPYTFLNFVLHWTFAFEVVIWLVAFGIFLRTKRLVRS